MKRIQVMVVFVLAALSSALAAQAPSDVTIEVRHANQWHKVTKTATELSFTGSVFSRKTDIRSCNAKLIEQRLKALQPGAGSSRSAASIPASMPSRQPIAVTVNGKSTQVHPASAAGRRLSNLSYEMAKLFVIAEHGCRKRR